MTSEKNKLSHLDEANRAKMVDVGSKPVTARAATAEAIVQISNELAAAIRENKIAKGNILEVARLAGIQAAKRTSELIPLCHPLGLNSVAVTFKVRAKAIEITCAAETNGQTGVEMEALTGVSVAALTLYDMCKAVDKTMRIENICVLKKIKE